MSDTVVGVLLEGHNERDAIHCAVAPVIAGERLKPGAHVGLNGEGEATMASLHIGIIDPFLKAVVEKGEQCWLFLYPRTITSLKHNWSHPAFPENAVTTLENKTASTAWLRQYVMRHCPYDEDQPDRGVSAFLQNVRERTIFYHGTDCHSSGDVEEADELYRHLSVILGYEINEAYFTGFSCSC